MKVGSQQYIREIGRRKKKKYIKRCREKNEKNELAGQGDWDKEFKYEEERVK